MRESNRLRRARLRDRRRGHEGWDDAPALMRPMTGYELYMVDRWFGHTILMVTDPAYRGEQLLASQRRVMALQEATGGGPFEPGAMAWGLLPSEHGVRVEGRRDPDGKMAFLLSDPDRPSLVYARFMAEREQHESPSSCLEGDS